MRRGLVPFDSRYVLAWGDVASRYDAVDEPELVALVASVLASGVSDRLAPTMSMFDLAVVRTPVPSHWPEDVVWVRPQRPTGSGARDVLVEHRSTTGRDDRVRRPLADVTPLFWRFVIEKFGVAPVGRDA